jgi:glycolate oxidase FAD binding subunit
MSDVDLSLQLQERVRAAQADGSPLCIRGSGTKAFYGRLCETDSILEVGGHRGVIAYEPTELAVTARAGTLLTELETLLEDNAQQLPFEPPHFGEGATLGGAVAAGLSGPRRPYAGAVRDAVLGAKIINGRGQILEFGGRVMKNVAGYDLSRLMAGALGTLGVLLEVSIKVQPAPKGETTLVRDIEAAAAIEQMNAWAATPMTITGTCHDGERLYARVCGGERALEAAQAAIGGEPLADARSFWRELRDQRLPFFRDAGRLWRLSVPPATPPLDLPGDRVLDWGGAQRWLRTEADTERVRAAAREAGGHATLFRGGEPGEEVFAPLSPALWRLHRNLKAALDPQGIFNPGRMYRGL